jgi:AraC family transcriptional regulator
MSEDTPRLVEREALRIVGHAQNHTGNASIPAQWQRFAAEVEQIPNRVAGTQYGVICGAAPGTGMRYLTGVAVRQTAPAPKGFDLLEIPAQRYAVYAYDGHVSGMGEAIHKIWAAFARTGLTHRPGAAGFFECYGEAFDAKAGRGGIEIWIPVE